MCKVKYDKTTQKDVVTKLQNLNKISVAEELSKAK